MRTYNVGVSSPTKKCLIIRNAYSYDFGGGEKFPVNLAVELKNLGYEPIVVSRSKKLLDYAKDQNIAYKKGWWWARQDWSGTKTLLFPVYLVWQFLLTCWYIGLILKHRPAVVHPQSRDDFIAATFAGRLLRKRVIWTDHADLKYIYGNHKSYIKNPVGKLVYFASKFAGAVTLVSKSEHSLIAEVIGHEPPKNYRVIYNGAFNDGGKKLSQKKHNDILTFICTSRLVKAKGIKELIEAFIKLGSTNKKVQLLIVGEGPDSEYFNGMAKGYANIKLVGYSANVELLLAQSDIFVHPSYHEGFSLSLVEATRAGLPIIACNVGGNLEIVSNGKNGILIPPQDADSLFNAMHKLAQDKELRVTYGVAARETYEKSFIFENIVRNNFVKLYNNKKPFTLLFDANPIINGNKSGIGYYTYYLINALSARYPEDIRLVGHYFNFLGKKTSLNLPKGLNISYRQSRIIPGKVLSLTRKLHFQLPLEIFFKQRGDAALFTNFVSLPSILHTPTHIVVHDMSFEDVPDYVAAKNRDFLHTFVPKSIKTASKVLTISEYSKESIIRHYGVDPDKIFITPIPPEKRDNRPILQSIIKGKYILFLGNLEPRKNIINLVKAYEELDTAIQNEYALVLAGGVGWYFETTLEYINKLKATGLNIQLTGYVTDEQRESLYQNAHLYAMASHYEGFGMPILEAMSYGVPTVVSDIPVFKEVAGDAAIYFNKDDPESIASAITKVLKDDGLRKKLLTDGHTIAAAYSWSQVAEKVYDEIINPPATS